MGNLNVIYRSNSHAPPWILLDKAGIFGKNGVQVDTSPQLHREKAVDAVLKKATLLRQGYGGQASGVLSRSASSRTNVRSGGFAPSGLGLPRRSLGEVGLETIFSILLLLLNLVGFRKKFEISQFEIPCLLRSGTTHR